jgi:hypothetical protein
MEIDTINQKSKMLLCSRACCKTAMWAKYSDPDTKKEWQLLMPLKDVTVKAVLDSGVATIDVQLSYINISSENPLECNF